MDQKAGRWISAMRNYLQPLRCGIVGIPSDAENELDRIENQHMDSGEDCYTRRKGILEQIKHRKL